MDRPDDAKLDAYLHEGEKQLKSRKPRDVLKTIKPPRQITAFMRWKACAAMDLITLFMILLVPLITGGICLMVNITVALYILCAAGAVILYGMIFSLYDFYHFRTWTTRLHFTLDGWQQAINSRSKNFWHQDGQYWVSTSITIVMNEPLNEKHALAATVFLKKLRKRLNQWTVSSEKHVGYADPNGWSILDRTITGDMNARVLNLVRKRLSGEFDGLVQLMPGSVHRVSINCSGKERHHEVYQDTSD